MTATLRADRAGNATGGTTFRPSDVPPGAAGSTFFLRRVVRNTAGDAVYQTDCVPVPLD